MRVASYRLRADSFRKGSGGSSSLLHPRVLQKRVQGPFQIKAFTKIAAVSSDFYISYINAQSFLNNYEETVTPVSYTHLMIVSIS